MSEARRLTLPSPDATAAFAARLAAVARPGDVILLGGDIGAGKTHFARAFIRSLQTVPEDVPSPTFTLVQTYDTARGEVWHADLYRLSGPDEVIELGLDAAMDSAICLIEWPDRLGPDAPKTALRLDLSPVSDTARLAVLDWSGGDWAARLTAIAEDIHA